MESKGDSFMFGCGMIVGAAIVLITFLVQATTPTDIAEALRQFGVYEHPTGDWRIIGHVEEKQWLEKEQQ